MTEEILLDAIYGIVENFCDNAQRDLDTRLEKWPVDLSVNEVREVVGGLMARQVSLAKELAKSPGIWTHHIAPLVLRAMADVYINVAWLLKDPSDRCRKFISFGLGQDKLQLEHRRARLKSGKGDPGELDALDATERWINSQHAIFLTDVDLGSWSGISIHAMAKESGCIDFYNFVYAPFSGCAHSMWQHVARYNLKDCRNPLHRYHSVPDVPDLPLDPNYLYLAAKYLQKTFGTFGTAFGIPGDEESAFKLLCDALDALCDDTNAEMDRPGNPP